MMKVKEYPGIYKDPESGAVVNKDNDALQKYKAVKRRMSRVDELEQTVQMLLNRLAELEKKIK